jgi:CBS domain-containing protein
VANLSATDVRRLAAEMNHFEDCLIWSVGQFFAYMYGSESEIPTPFTISDKTSIEGAADWMIQNHFHRIWVVNTRDDDVVVGCVSLTDVIRAVSARTTGEDA